MFEIFKIGLLKLTICKNIFWLTMWVILTTVLDENYNFKLFSGQ